MEKNELNTSNNQSPAPAPNNSSNIYDLAMCVVKWVTIAILGTFVADKAINSDKEVHFKHDPDTLEFDVKFKPENRVIDVESKEVEPKAVDVTEETKEISSDSSNLS